MTSPGPPGILEASANLDDAIKNIAQAPASFDGNFARGELFQLYAIVGSGAASIVLERCMRIMRDPNESLEGKIVAVRILDALMVEHGNSLARAFVSQLRFFTGIAKRSKERERKKRRPTGMFHSRVGDDEVAQFVAAVGELLDKWGRHFQEELFDAELKEIAKARADLLEDRVKLPSPESYRYLGGSGGGIGGPSQWSVGGVGGGGGGAGALDEGHLSRLADEFQSTLQRLGPEATETAEAHSRFEAELDQWRRAAQEAAERDDFAGYERYSEVAIRLSELGHRLETSAANSAAASAASTPATSPAPPAERGTWPGAEEASGGSRRKRHHSRPPKDSGGCGGGFPMGAEVGGFNPGFPLEGFGGFNPPANPGLPPEAAPSFSLGPEAGSFPFFPPQPPLQQQEDPFSTSPGPIGGTFGGSFGGPSAPCGAGFGQEVGGPAPGGRPLEPLGSFGAPAGGLGPPPGSAGGPPAPPFGGASRRGFAGPSEEPAPDVPPPLPPPPFEQRAPEGPSEREATLMRMNAQLMSQVQALQANNKTLQAQLELRASEGTANASPEQLRSAMRRLRDLEPLQAELADSRATATSLRELTEQLQGELDRSRRELRQALQRAAEVEERLAEREDVITETRQRLFDAKQRSAQLEDEMKNQSEAQRHLQGRLQTARADREVSELELRHLRGAIASVGALPLQSEQRRGNQSYSRDMSAVASQGSRAVISPPLSVNQSDELAGSAMSAGRSEDGGGGTPLQQLARSRVGSKLGDQAEHTSERIPSIPLSAPEVWQRTPRIARPPGAIVSQSPAASRACLERVNANFQTLLVADRGVLYEDQGLVMSMSIVVVSASGGGRPCIDFEACVANGSGRALHDVQMRPSDPSARSRACDLRIEAEPLRAGATGAQARPQQRRFRGRLEVFGPFESGPQVDLAYLLPDNLSLRVRLRLPLAITRFMHPGKLEAARAAEFWADPELAHSEVAVVCTVRRRLLGAGAPFSVFKCMELGGVFRCFPGVDENPRGAVFSSAYPQRQGQWSEVLVRAELGAPFAAKGESDVCRVAVRSASHEVNKVLAQVFLDVLCDAPESAAAA